MHAGRVLLAIGEKADACWEAEARLRLAFIEATLSGHGASTGVINVSDQRYQNAVDGMENGMEDLETRDGDLTAQIRIESVRMGPYKVK